MSRSLDFTACNLPCKNPCWRLTKEEIEWLEKKPNRQVYTLVCLEKQDGKDFVKKFNAVKDFIIENNLHKTMYKSRTQDCIDKIKRGIKTR